MSSNGNKQTEKMSLLCSKGTPFRENNQPLTACVYSDPITYEGHSLRVKGNASPEQAGLRKLKADLALVACGETGNEN